MKARTSSFKERLSKVFHLPFTAWVFSSSPLSLFTGEIAHTCSQDLFTASQHPEHGCTHHSLIVSPIHSSVAAASPQFPKDANRHQDQLHLLQRPYFHALISTEVSHRTGRGLGQTLCGEQRGFT
jgi:hypothetical protein